MTDNQKQVSNSDEIDLGVLFSKIGDFFKNIGMGFLRFLALLRRIPLDNKILFISLMILGLAGGLSYYSFFKQKYYSTTMILSSEFLNQRIVANALEKLNLLTSEPEKKGLMKELNISIDIAKNIGYFEAKPFVEENELVELEGLKQQLKDLLKNEKLTTEVFDRIDIENRHAYEITVHVLKPGVVGELETALLDHFRNNAYLKKRIEISISNKQALRKKLIRDSQKLDSLKSVIYANYENMAAQSRQGSNNVILSDKAVTNPIDIFNQDIILYKDIQLIDRSLYLHDDFELVDGFTEFNEPSTAGLTRTSVYAVLIAIGLGYLIVALVSFNRYLSKIA